jgi:hypothetical protein
MSELANVVPVHGIWAGGSPWSAASGGQEASSCR